MSRNWCSTGCTQSRPKTGSLTLSNGSWRWRWGGAWGAIILFCTVVNRLGNPIGLTTQNIAVFHHLPPSFTFHCNEAKWRCCQGYSGMGGGMVWRYRQSGLLSAYMTDVTWIVIGSWWYRQRWVDWSRNFNLVGRTGMYFLTNCTYCIVTSNICLYGCLQSKGWSLVESVECKLIHHYSTPAWPRSDAALPGNQVRLPPPPPLPNTHTRSQTQYPASSIRSYLRCLKLHAWHPPCVATVICSTTLKHAQISRVWTNGSSHFPCIYISQLF